MMGYGNRSFGNTVGMMGYGNHSSYFGSYGILAATTWILVIAFLISGIYFFIKNARKK